MIMTVASLNCGKRVLALVSVLRLLEQLGWPGPPGTTRTVTYGLHTPRLALLCAAPTAPARIERYLAGTSIMIGCILDPRQAM